MNKLSTYFVKPLKFEQKEKDVILAQKELTQSSKIENNTIHLTSDDIDEKLAHIYAMAQSLKLSIYEAKVEDTIQGAKKVPKAMANNGEINLS